MERTSQHPGFLFTFSVRAALVLCFLLIVPVVATAQETEKPEPPPLTLQMRDNLLGASMLWGLGYGEHPGFSQLLYYGNAIHNGQFTDLSPRLGGTARSTACVATILLSGTSPTAPFEALGLLRAGENLRCWDLYDPDVVRPLKKELFSSVADQRGMPDQVGGVARHEYEAEAFNDAIIKASQTRPEVFDRAVQRDGKAPVVTYAHLMKQPATYRGEVVRIEGKIRRVKKDPNPDLVHKMTGIEATYECWLINDEYGPTNPVCIRTTELPPGLTVNEKILKDNPVAFVGYFFKKYRFEAGTADKPKLQRDAPLIIGHIIPLRPIEPEDDNGDGLRSATGQIGEWSKNLLIGFLLLVGLTVVIVGGLSWWFNKGDAEVRMRMLARPMELPEPDKPPEDAMTTEQPVIPLAVRRSMEQPPPN